MSLESALKIDASLFDPALVTEQTKAYNAGVLKLGEQGPQWWEVRNFILPTTTPLR
jgi:hypothetical protein